MAISFKDMLSVDYMPGQDPLINKNAKKRKQDIPTGNTGESVEPTDEALSLAQRRKRSIQMKKYKSRLAIGKKKALSRVADTARLKRRARKAARAAMAKRISKGVSKAEMTAARKQQIEKMLDKMPARIDKIAKRLLPKMRKKELARKRSK